MTEDRSQTWCIVGAGPAGLAAIKNFRARGIAVEAFEREDDVGGNWYFGKPSSSVYASTHMISSKRLTEYSDFPMPKSFPPYPSHRQALAYLRDYARHFDLYESIAFNTSIVRATPLDAGWEVELSNGETRRYAGLVVANGHHWDPLRPTIPGEFTGEQLHTHDYKTPEVLAGKRVLVIGAGNSGCDLAVEAAQFAESACISLRRGYHFLPKFAFGRPIDSGNERLQRWRLPLWLRRGISSLFTLAAIGRPETYGLPRPDHKLFETHPIINSQLLYFVGHGRIGVRPGIAEFAGREVVFTDGRRETFDLIVYATGYHIRVPFLDRGLLFDERDRPRLHLNVFPPHREDLLVIGLIQPNSGLWGLADWQAKLATGYLVAKQKRPQLVDWLTREIARGHDDLSGGIHYLTSPRHALEVEYYSYRERLKRLVAKVESSLA